ncbi:MAG: 16S rRNA (uracil(1498)-N(3))-methyltransferase [Candidatus Kinetoplastibacterium crithidii]|nr:MAG: 16S rRNA (uracil(1498)-N(3))-methyltransferase [Candidatus Kinetoplastibacterium crithidii]
MRRPRFFLENYLSSNIEVLLPKEITHYAKQVLRLQNNDNIILFNGKNGEYNATITFAKGSAYAKILSFNSKEIELQGSITLIQSLTTNNKMDLIIEKAVELGVQKIIPLKTNRSIVQLTNEKLQNKIMHWKKIIESASSQCGRNQLMTIENPISLDQYLEKISNQIHLFCHLSNSQTLTEVLKKQIDIKKLSIMIGPEGGWTDQECVQVKKIHDIKFVNFGNRILRTETAGITITAAVISLMNWY